MRVVILAALFPEARAIARAFHLPAPPLPSRQTTADSPVEGPIAVRLVGIGARHLDQLPAQKPRALIMAGLAGALAPDLAVGDVVIQGSCPPLPGVRFGVIGTSSHLIATPADKENLFRQSGALAVDMETGPAQRLAESLHIPFLAVRAISDTAAQTLDPAFLTLVDSDGRPRIGRVLRQLAGGSVRLSDLLRVRRATNVALARLSATLVALLASGWPDRA
jgi:adenosylhomocysteine nucleosidase